MVDLQNMPGKPREVLDVFQPGLVRGEEHLAYDPTKGYFYVEHPTEGWRVYLRMCCFVYEEGVPFDAKRFLVVKRTGADPKSKAWEPPKGQMEGKDALKHPRTSVLKLIMENVRRETWEEAHIGKLHNLRHTGLIFQETEPDYPENTYFQYHCFVATTPAAEIQRGLAWFKWLEDHPKAFARLKRDKKEKDALRWFDARETRMMGRWSPRIIPMYLAEIEK
jgi:8-oxo-dGTP pyrophosphatase MutT (NUDIX family)